MQSRRRRRQLRKEYLSRILWFTRLITVRLRHSGKKSVRRIRRDIRKYIGILPVSVVHPVLRPDHRKDRISIHHPVMLGLPRHRGGNFFPIRLLHCPGSIGHQNPGITCRRHFHRNDFPDIPRRQRVGSAVPGLHRQSLAISVKTVGENRAGLRPLCLCPQRLPIFDLSGQHDTSLQYGRKRLLISERYTRLIDFRLLCAHLYLPDLICIISDLYGARHFPGILRILCKRIRRHLDPCASPVEAIFITNVIFPGKGKRIRSAFILYPAVCRCILRRCIRLLYLIRHCFQLSGTVFRRHFNQNAAADILRRQLILRRRPCDLRLLSGTVHAIPPPGHRPMVCRRHFHDRLQCLSIYRFSAQRDRACNGRLQRRKLCGRHGICLISRRVRSHRINVVSCICFQSRKLQFLICPCLPGGDGTLPFVGIRSDLLRRDAASLRL